MEELHGPSTSGISEFGPLLLYKVACEPIGIAVINVVVMITLLCVTTPCVCIGFLDAMEQIKLNILKDHAC